MSAPTASAPTARRGGALLGAAFLMATSAIGPGFLTQTAVFTEQLGASFGFVILASIVLDLGAQLNIWRVIAATGRRAQDLANHVLRGFGHTLALLVAIGGLAFNVGNVAGAGLGLNVITGISVELGAVLSAGVAIALFLVREAGRAMDRFAKTLGLLMIGLTVYVAVVAGPPMREAAIRSVAPIHIDVFAILTLVGGTVGGYITFAGGHRLVDAGIRGVAALPQVMRAATTGILVTGLMRVLLFLAAFGVVAQGLTLDPVNPPASVFRHAAGELGFRLFGVVMWAAAATSVVGASYTSVSFLRTLNPAIDRYDRTVIIAFILFATAIFLLVGRPVQVLILVGALNALILPLGLSLMLIAAHRRNVAGEYRHPMWLTVFGSVTATLTTLLAIRSIVMLF
jgi:Mn2+/Fe2+ NRAMP family transporter